MAGVLSKIQETNDNTDKVFCKGKTAYFGTPLTSGIHPIIKFTTFHNQLLKTCVLS
jgi:hypothetical protein